ncbi:mediator of RNA polymerase II transcription subunit 5 [[Candida] anglica]|uniref:Mediator of RNA polymerase II transcription subunit 5 n=1 Tax=[Candida] anglica TaxID=148631 RepID=A0ABP0EQJ7_9ASCO
MSSDKISLRKVVSLAISRKTPPNKFVQLYNQLDQRESISDNEYVTSLMEASSSTSLGAGNNGIYLEYALSVALTNESRLVRFWVNMPKLTPMQQSEYLKIIPNFIIPQISPNEKLLCHSKGLVDSLVNLHLVDYSLNLLWMISNGSDGVDLKPLFTNVVLLWCLVAQKIPHLVKTECLKMIASKSVKLLSGKLDDESLSKLFIQQTKHILDVRDFEGVTHVIGHSNSVDSGLPGTLATNSTSFHNTRNLFDGPKSVVRATKLLQVKRYVWLNHLMVKGNLMNPKTFLKEYERRFTTRLGKGYVLFHELVVSTFKGIASAITMKQPNYVIWNWVSFLLTIIVRIPSELGISSLSSVEGIERGEETVEDAIFHAFAALDEKCKSVLVPMELQTSFVKSCIYNETLQLSSFNKLFPESPSFQMNDLSHLKNSLTTPIMDDMKFKLLDVNSEFTSLEESGLLEYINSLTGILQYSWEGAVELSETICKIIDDLISDKENDKLNRLLLTVMNNSKFLTMLCSRCEDGPHTILNKLMKYIDREDFSTDDDNFQETYAHFGVILLSIILISEHFNIDHSKLLIKESYTLDYVNGFYYRLCESLTSIPTPETEEDKTIVENYNNLISDWINALYDDSEDGLSDELIKSVNIKQIYKIISLIFRQGILACGVGKIDEKILNNGIDYLTQSFLIPCTLNIIKWLLTQTWVESSGLVVQEGKDGASSLLSVKVLHLLIKSNLNGGSESNTEPILTFRLVLNSIGSEILTQLRKLPGWESSELVNEIISFIDNNVDNDYRIRPDREVSTIMKKRENTVEELKQHLIHIVDSSDTSFIHYDSKLVDYVLSNDKRGLISLICEEIYKHHFPGYTHDVDEVRIFLNLILFIVMQDNTESEFWFKELSKLEIEGFSGSGKGFDTKFSTSMAYHYSSIFNIPEENSDDDLFNEHINLEENSTRAVLVRDLSRSDSFFAELLRVKKSQAHKSEEVRNSVQALVNQILKELSHLVAKDK